MLLPGGDKSPGMPNLASNWRCSYSYGVTPRCAFCSCVTTFGADGRAGFARMPSVPSTFGRRRHGHRVLDAQRNRERILEVAKQAQPSVRLRHCRSREQLADGLIESMAERVKADNWLVSEEQRNRTIMPPQCAAICVHFLT
jgi:hypothetical protein